MEVIPFASYTEHEKLAIARQFLVPRQTRDHGLEERHLIATTDLASYSDWPGLAQVVRIEIDSEGRIRRVGGG